MPSRTRSRSPITRKSPSPSTSSPTISEGWWNCCSTRSDALSSRPLRVSAKPTWGAFTGGCWNSLLLHRKGTAAGSGLMGIPWKDERWLWSRDSAADPTGSPHLLRKKAWNGSVAETHGGHRGRCGNHRCRRGRRAHLEAHPSSDRRHCGDDDHREGDEDDATYDRLRNRHAGSAEPGIPELPRRGHGIGGERTARSDRRSRTGAGHAGHDDAGIGGDVGTSRGRLRTVEPHHAQRVHLLDYGPDLGCEGTAGVGVVEAHLGPE